MGGGARVLNGKGRGDEKILGLEKPPGSSGFVSRPSNDVTRTESLRPHAQVGKICIQSLHPLHLIKTEFHHYFKPPVPWGTATIFVNMEPLLSRVVGFPYTMPRLWWEKSFCILVGIC